MKWLILAFAVATPNAFAGKSAVYVVNCSTVLTPESSILVIEDFKKNPQPVGALALSLPKAYTLAEAIMDQGDGETMETVYQWAEVRKPLFMGAETSEVIIRNQKITQVCGVFKGLPVRRFLRR